MSTRGVDRPDAGRGPGPRWVDSGGGAAAGSDAEHVRVVGCVTQAGSAGADPRLPAFATRAVAADLALGWMVREQALRKPPACRSIAMVTVGGTSPWTTGSTPRWWPRGAATA